MFILFVSFIFLAESQDKVWSREQIDSSQK